MKEAQLYLGMDTQDVEWSLVCGTTGIPSWTGSVRAYDPLAFSQAIESARLQCGLTAGGFKVVALFEDIPWEDFVWRFLDDLGVEAHVLDATGVPPDLAGQLDEEGFYKAPTLYTMLARYFGQRDNAVLRTLPPDHAFVEDLEYSRKERIQLRKEYRRHLDRIRSIISHAGCKVPKAPNSCAFSTLRRRDGKVIETHLLARLERQRARAELVADQHALVEDEFLDYRHANAETLQKTPVPYQDEPIDMTKASRKLAVVPTPQRLLQSTPADVLLPALQNERKKIAREMVQHRDRLRNWCRQQNVEVSSDLMGRDPATYRTNEGDRLPRALVMLLRRVGERFDLAARQYAVLAHQIDHCRTESSEGTLGVSTDSKL